MSSFEKLLDSAVAEEFVTPIRLATTKVIWGLCRAWLALKDDKDMIRAFEFLAEAQTAAHEYLNTVPESKAEESGISVDSLKSGVYETVILIENAAKEYDENFVPGLEPTSGLRSSEIKLDCHLGMAKIMLDGWMNSRTAHQCRRHDRLLNPSRHVSEN